MWSNDLFDQITPRPKRKSTDGSEQTFKQKQKSEREKRIFHTLYYSFVGNVKTKLTQQYEAELQQRSHKHLRTSAGGRG